ncbi:hypothetical protein SNE40_001496 [Patella caerulea]|uniref:Uncharacterized protein n=1 Tax=Patella caerulea TaxID=87958 RepID=A0AAN8KEP3_PATCE
MQDQTGPLTLMRNVQDLRQRLAETESNLKKINRLEKVELDEVESVASSNNEDCIRRRVQRLEKRFDVNNYPAAMNRDGVLHASLLQRDSGTIADDFLDRESVRSGLSTVPDSYTGFTNRQFPSSTPNAQRATAARGQIEGHYDSEDSNFDRGRLDTKTKENKDKVVRQNQRLLAEVEKLAYELQSANCKIRELTRELKSGQQSIPELEDKIIGQQSEIDALEKALRKAEENFEENQRQVASVEKHVSNYRDEVDELRLQLNKERKSRKYIETQRDEALQNFLETQESLEEYQKKMRSKVKKQEEGEDYIRDMLDRANSERDDLLEQLATMTSTLQDHEEEIRRLQTLEEVEAETKTEMEEENTELRKQIAKLSSKINKLQGEGNNYDTLQRENSRLKDQMEHQERQLLQLQQEVEESRTMLVQLEQLADTVQQGASGRDYSGTNDSGLSSIHQHSNSRRNSGPTVSFSKSLTEQKQTSSRPAKSIVSELRVKLAMKDSEIQRLQALLYEHESNNNTSIIHSLKTEINHMTEKQKEGVQKSRELESIITQLETDNTRLREQVTDLRRDMSDREGFNMSLDTRLAQRNSQIIELQEDINKKCNDISQLERELRKKNSQVISVQEQLDEKLREYSSHIARSKQLEEEIISRDEEITSLQAELQTVQTDVQKLRKASETAKQTHKNQCLEYEKQIEMLQDDNERKSTRVKASEKQVKKLQDEVNFKTQSYDEMERQLEDLKEELSGRTRQNQSAFNRLEKQTEEREAKISQLESTLLLCKDEISSYITTLDDSKRAFERELSKKKDVISALEIQLQEMKCEVDDKRRENIEYERSILERQTMLQQQSIRIAELEDNQTDLHRQVARLEQELLKTRGTNKTEIEELERKLHQACLDLEQKTKDVNDHLHVIRDYQEEKKELTSELQIAEEKLEEEQKANRASGPKISKLEKEVRDLRVQLEQKIEIISDFEEQRKMREEDMSQQLGLVSNLDSHILKLKADIHKIEDSKAELERQLQKMKYEAQAKSQLLDDTQDMLSKTENELRERNIEVDELRQSLDERQKELDERVQQLNTLSCTIKDTHEEMEKRMGKLNDTLHKYEIEIKDRTKQIADLDDTLHQTRSQLQETTLNRKQADQLAQRQQMELQATSAKLSELQKMTERQKHRLEEQKEENVDITQELRLTREQLQQQHGELMLTRRELAQAHREQERLMRELEDTNVASQHQESDTVRLAEELGTARAREAWAETKLTAEVQQLTGELDDARFQLEKEVSKGKDSEKEIKSLKNQLKEAVESKSREVRELDEDYKDQLIKAHDELDCLQNELLTRKQVIDVANETIVIKEAEITRLQTRISGYERAALSQVLKPKETVKPEAKYPTLVTSSNQQQGQVTLTQTEPERLTNQNGQIESEARHNGHAMFQTQNFHQKQFYIEGLSEISGENILPPHIAMNRENPSFQTLSNGLEQRPPVRVLNFDSEQNTNHSQALLQMSNGSMILPHPSNRISESGEYPYIHSDPVTAVGVYQTTEDDLTMSPENCYQDIRERLRCNALRQQMIEHELKMMDSEENVNMDLDTSTTV